MISGWVRRYNEILKEFKYDKKNDLQSAILLDRMLNGKSQIKNLQKMIKNQNVLVIGSGPSLSRAIPRLKN